jgi:hypothetical protein
VPSVAFTKTNDRPDVLNIEDWYELTSMPLTVTGCASRA